MKKWKTIPIICGVIIYSAMLLFVLKNKPENISINLKGFPGRIFKAENITYSKTSAPAITDSFAEMQKNWNEESILSYGENGIEIWQPDKTTPGVFRYTCLVSKKAFYRYSAKVDDDEKSIAFVAMIRISFLIVIAIVLIALIGIITILYEVLYPKKY